MGADESRGAMLSRSIRALTLAAVVALLAGACAGEDTPAPTVTLPETTVGPSTTRAASTDTTTIPTTIPVGDAEIVVSSGDDLGALVSAAPEGVTFTLRAGTHRLHSIVPKDGMTFQGEPGAIMSGAMLLDGFVRDGSVWRLTGLEQTGQERGRCVGDYVGCELSQDLFMDDVMLWQVTDMEELGEGRWLWSGDTIFVADDPGNRRVELSVAEHAFLGDADDVTIADLAIVKYATPAQEGTVQAQSLADGERGQRWVMRNIEVAGSHGVGIRTGDFTLVSGANVHHNGQMGIAVSGGVDVVIEDTEIGFNNIAGFDWTWEGGGMKATRTDGLVVRRVFSHDNTGPGLWTDIDTADTLYEENRVVNNSSTGIFHEISGAAVIRDNTVEGNGFGKPDWLWGAGILVAASNNVEIYGNYVVDNADGIGGIQQERNDGPAAPYLLKDVLVYDNTIRMLEGQTGVVDDTGDDAVFTDRNIVFRDNTYLDLSGRRFAWGGRVLDMRGWIDAGQGEGAQWVESGP
jgi:parallel beta-helix repeat protein